MRLLLTASLLCASITAASAQSAPKFVPVDHSAMMSSNLVGLDVYNNDNKDIGQIKDLVMKDAAVAGYVLSVGGFLGVGSRYVVVDPSSVKVKYDDKDKKWHANMNASADQLKTAPEYKYEGKADASKS